MEIFAVVDINFVKMKKQRFSDSELRKKKRFPSELTSSPCSTKKLSLQAEILSLAETWILGLQ